MAFVFNLGITKIPLMDETGKEFGVAAYNPKDFGILTRAKEAEKELDKIPEIFSKYMEEDGAEKALEMMQSACNKLKKYCDFVFGDGFYDGAFTRVNPFTEIQGGNWLCVEVIKSVLEDLQEKAKNNKDKMDKYLKGYTNA